MGDCVPAKLDRTGKAVAKVLEAAQDAMVVVGADGRIVRVNTQAEQLFGYSQEELSGQKPDLLMPRRLRWHDLKHRAGHVAHARLRPLGDGLGVLARPGWHGVSRRSQSELPGTRRGDAGLPIKPRLVSDNAVASGACIKPCRHAGCRACLTLVHEADFPYLLANKDGPCVL